MMDALKHKLFAHIGQEFSDGSWRSSFDDGKKWLLRMENGPPLTIIVPVYNGYDVLIPLLNSLETAKGVDAVILVNDHSYDHRIDQLCKRWSEKSEKRTYVQNQQNLGFVRSVNIGIASSHANHDVVILNSDTVLSEHSMVRLKRASCSLPNIATVTPLSNSAGVFSVPQPKTFNPLEAGWSVNQYAGFLEFVSGSPYEVVPAGAGFCLYITRKAINSVGLFDEMLFERGYAEESDFCRRAVRKGFVNLLDVSSFVFHESEVSFGLEKARLKKRNATLLKIIDHTFIQDSLQWEQETKLKHIWKVFPELIKELKNSGQTYIIPGLAGKTRLVVNKNNSTQKGYLNQKERCIVLHMVNGQAVIDFFGLVQKKVQMDSVNQDDLTAYLFARWNVSEIIY